MSDKRWFVDEDWQPVDWDRAVLDGHAAHPIYAATLDSGRLRPWRVIWAAPGQPVTGEMVAWAKSVTTQPPTARQPRPNPAGLHLLAHPRGG